MDRARFDASIVRFNAEDPTAFDDYIHPAVWMQAHKETTVVTQDEVFELLRQVSGD